jgi:hypothetical protein
MMEMSADQKQAEALVADIIRDICELPDYQSPDDQPDLVMATIEELTIILERNLTRPDPKPSADSAGLVDQLRAAALGMLNTDWMHDVCRKAATTLAAKDAEITRLRKLASNFLNIDRVSTRSKDDCRVFVDMRDWAPFIAEARAATAKQETGHD